MLVKTQEKLSSQLTHCHGCADAQCASARCAGLLGVFLSLQYLRDVACRHEPDWRMRTAQIVPETLT